MNRDELIKLNDSICNIDGLKWNLVAEREMLSGRWWVSKAAKKRIKEVDELISRMIEFENHVQDAIKNETRPRDSLKVVVLHNDPYRMPIRAFYDTGYYMIEQQQIEENAWKTTFLNHR